MRGVPVLRKASLWGLDLGGAAEAGCRDAATAGRCAPHGA